MSSINPDVIVDVTGEICPIPMVEFRKAYVNAEKGDIILIIGTHESSKKEIPMAAEGAGAEVLKIEEEEGGLWRIFIKK